MIKNIGFSLLTTQYIHSKEDCRFFIGKVREMFGDKALPRKYGPYEPNEFDFNINDIADFEELWQEGVSWVYNFPRWHGQIESYNDLKTTHNIIEYDFQIKKNKDAIYKDFLMILSSKYHADFSYYCFFDDDIDYYDDNLSQISTRHLENWLPGIPWMGVFGKPYIDMFGRDKILSMPVFSVEEISEDIIFFQLTETLHEAINGYEQFAQLREKVKDHLGRQAFLSQPICDENGDYAPAVEMLPKFDLAEPPPRHY
ncbi:MAG: hypothetical protein D6B27_07350 [Gammaproteobacteria bacterium]|nr:MAG: hypothetical protein D6B27_07350 [Gammaproteobacteria bacterium]